jgi:trehalose synthase
VKAERPQVLQAPLEPYRAVVGDDVLDELYQLGAKLEGRTVQHINSTRVGGGVAEILARLVPLMNGLGIEATWDVLEGEPSFFQVTKAFHNALHGARVRITERMIRTFRDWVDGSQPELPLYGDPVIIHDPQPLGLINRRRNGARWVWRCHIDVSSPHPVVWDLVCDYLRRYDASIFSMPEFSRPLSLPQFQVYPSIDPLSEKNRELGEGDVQEVLERYGIDGRRPLVTQISRFDRLKDPVGVIEAYRLVRRRQDCQLILAGGGADDDPEGARVLAEVRECAGGDPDVHVLELPPGSDLEINALVRGSTVVVQKSLREGFGLTVAEALWKAVPVVGGAVGGIRAQILDGVTGYLVNSVEGCASRVRRLLAEPGLARRLGENGRQHVRTHFLTTRHLKDYLLLLLTLDHGKRDLIRL